ncbi:receptor-like protein EIX2 [Argentina anserina]|uniref:receptor-like protein EIX2 n=1 Tax=Argentina anserina TaxID=57926 RepID=UPI0021763990|nr:receptor-like protein EIX2 [Potentilla anserina]
MLQLRSNSFSGHIPQQLCNLPDLQILDLAHNNFSGTIPKCLSKLTSLVSADSGWTFFGGYPEQTTVTSKGQELEYGVPILTLVKSIDLSSNQLKGVIPESITNLVGLTTLNLSRNQLHGNIPSKIGNLHWLESLNLSHNHLSGRIPQSFSSLTSLSHLNLSYNNLTGRIPSGNQLQTLEDSSIYEGNPSLCGVPLSIDCPGDERQVSPEDDKDEHDYGRLGLYVSIVLGFSVGFCGVCGTLIIKKSWRYAYFSFFDNIKDEATLAIASRIARLIPPYIPYMRILSLRNNQLSGEFPEPWSLWSTIGVVDVTNNTLTGHIPSSMGVPSSLGILKMNNNNFSGEIPASLQNCSGLGELWCKGGGKQGGYWDLACSFLAWAAAIKGDWFMVVAGCGGVVAGRGSRDIVSIHKAVVAGSWCSDLDWIYWVRFG